MSISFYQQGERNSSGMLHLTLAWPNPKASGRHVDTSGAHAAAQYCGGCASPGRAHDVGYRRCAKTGVASLKLPMRLEYPEYQRQRDGTDVSLYTLYSSRNDKVVAVPRRYDNENFM